MKAGFEVAVYTRTKEKAADVIAEGAVWCEDVKTCAAGREAVITIVGYPKDVEEVYFGDDGIIASADPGTFLIDMTTTSPKLAVRIYEDAAKTGLRPWERTSSTKEKRAMASIRRCATRLP